MVDRQKQSIKEKKLKSTLSLADAMSIIKGSKIRYKSEYEKFVRDNNLKEIGLPLYPVISYGNTFPGWDEFLGNPEGTAKATVSAIRVNSANNSKFWKKSLTHSGVSKPKPSYQKPQPVVVTQDMSMANILQTLHNDYGIALPTLYRLNEEAKQTSSMKIEAINETLNVLLKIAIEKSNIKVKV